MDVSVLPHHRPQRPHGLGRACLRPDRAANGVDPRNGGIVGTVSYDTTRNELDPQYAAAEDWQPGISDVPVELYAPVAVRHDAARPATRPAATSSHADGSYAKGKLLNTYVTEHWSRPTGCVARDVDGNPLVHGVDENVLAPNQETNGECISSFMQSVQFGPYPTDQGTPDANFGAAVDGNYGFGDGCFNGTLDATRSGQPGLQRRHVRSRCRRPRLPGPGRRSPTTPAATRCTR